MGFEFESHTASHEFIASSLNIRNLEVERPPETFGVWFFRATQQKAHISRCEKGHRWRRVEKVLHSQSVTIKDHSVFEVAHGNSHLTDLAQREVRVVGIHDAMLYGGVRQKLLQNCFLRFRHARGDEPATRVNQELKLPRLSKPTAKQISVIGSSVRSKRNFARST